MTTKYIPVTPGGTLCTWISAKTEKQAWKNLLVDASHMPYKTKSNFIARGYTVIRMGGLNKMGEMKIEIGSEELRKHFKGLNRPKSKAEWWAIGHIERLEKENAQLAELILKLKVANY